MSYSSFRVDKNYESNVLTKLNIKNKGLLYFFFFFLAIALVSLISCLFVLKHIAIQEVIDGNERYQLYVLANKLRQSSDDLTELARLYVITGEKKYRDYYNETLSIRNGSAPLPSDYDELYWDFVMGNKPPHTFKPAKSLAAMMLEHQFTLKEFSLLNEAENQSNKLAETETQAMNLVEGKYQDKSGNYSIIGKPDPQLAQQMVFGEDYLKKKLQVMKPLQEFFTLVNNRTFLKNEKIDLEMSKIIALALALSILSTILMLFFIIHALNTLSKVNEENDLLLLNILPESIASRLKMGEEEIADEFSQASVMFADIINFTQLTEQLGAKKTVGILNRLFAELDKLTEKYHVEKVKTIGDNYMAVSGVPEQTTRHAINIANYALAVLDKMMAFNKENQMNLQFRIGITYGTVIAGIIGHKKFVYDIWGNVVNLASRLEETSLPNKIHISEKMAFMLADEFIVEPRDVLKMKGIGEVKTYFLLGKKEK
ncbi:adenylate/guanylate cyclase domain-containing protein [Fluoribacter dumoffii]|uniref:Adenylate cyclase n=1 Tax=Fluoribacter dumoffii TaxID=463 RepID=A0A377GD11_9GAMM|nr:adenylate/guanylate cyclase domain-containing protein [Fluoribacter dumoffii]KTC90833.1 guanylate cyclase [Fluoribacter dumoffii NY 23]MCW8386677.1 adenylate/guanylate cyclase domain-containing protein [Fluoribacter dumoffii]MCW8419732.1 adenylate/guanylate cyclase domain-containing protein [Fluoribacter dumoffii]MCW8455565.1 adenylate/guanylate cyclase domain-containing protein [Fluoribacter dumoffii]MCW8460355.1 adenylate/guanylate cyclase domain-containing protein [Fluoribacter dumoffii]